MAIAAILQAFRADVAQCDALISNAHRMRSNGDYEIPDIDRKQIIIAAFLNQFLAWETFLEESLACFMVGEKTLNETAPIRYVCPGNIVTAKQLVIGPMRHFDYGNHDFFRKVVNLYFDNGYPYEPHLGALVSDLCDIRTMRNCSAHISSSTQTALEALAMRICARPMSGIDLHTLLTLPDPRSNQGETVYLATREKLLVGAELIATG